MRVRSFMGKLLGRKLFVRYEPDDLRCLNPGIHPAKSVHHIGLCHHHQQFKRKRPTVQRWSTGELLSGWFWIGAMWQTVINLSMFLFQKLERHFMSYIITYYLPSGLFVVVSWISFLIPPDIVPGIWHTKFISFSKRMINYINILKI